MNNIKVNVKQFTKPSLDKTLIKISESVISNQLAYFSNEEIKHTKYYKGDLKKWLNMTTKRLEKAEALEYDMVYEKEEHASDELTNTRLELIKLIAKTGLRYDDHFIQLIEAYLKDPSSMLGIARKVNR